ncbi:MAG: hypothetical protein RQ936_12670, partial [Gammaproteobacteria bacterium]|nr:hypothetical protein [Gammaproteobacteria bacterium]
MVSGGGDDGGVGDFIAAHDGGEPAGEGVAGLDQIARTEHGHGGAGGVGAAGVGRDSAGGGVGIVGDGVGCRIVIGHID